MKKLIAASTLFFGACVFAGTASAADAMAGAMQQQGGAPAGG